MKTLAIVLIVIGGLMTAFTGFNIITKEKVVDLGPLEVKKEKKTPVYWSPVTGGIILVLGIVVMVTSKKGASS